jgi:hypothetical protein
MNNYEKADRIRDIASEISDLICEARELANDAVPSYAGNWDAYVWEQMTEHLQKRNRYNTDMEDVANTIENSDNYEDEDEDEECD